jgi:uncharacterized protein (DUF608 family)
MDHPHSTRCCSPECGCAPERPDRRTFLSTAGLGLTSLLAGDAAVAGPFEGKDFEALVPADKKLRPEWLRSLSARGQPAVYRGDELAFLGMPVGGIAAGQLYLGGDGKLWHWDIFNLPQPDNFRSAAGPNYAHPPRPASPVEQGFAVRVTAGGRTLTRSLDRQGFRDVSFRGEYPIGFVDHADPEVPLRIRLEAFSPFIPLSVADSTLPATILHFTLTSSSTEPITVELAGWLENAVCLASGKAGLGRRRFRALREPGLTVLHGTAEPLPATREGRPDIVFEDFEKDRYEGWSVEGEAFGKGPARRAAIPSYQGDIGGRGERVVNSHASAPGTGIGEKDARTGKLTSKKFTIERDYIHFFLGGGNHPGKTCLNLRIGDKVERTATGRNDNRMRVDTFDVRDFRGQEAVLEIVDAVAGGWGNVGVDHIVFSDRPPLLADLPEQPDFGSLALALVGRSDGDLARPGLPLEPQDAVFPAREVSGETEATQLFGKKLVGALGRRWRLKPGEKAEATFVLAWYFPALPAGRFTQLADAPQRKRSYAARFDSAAAVARHVAAHFDRLASGTRLWNRTWYDSTLPYWLLDRAFYPIGCLATATFYQFTSGRFYGYEGTYCCDGTCTHVWQYAQGAARIFPAIERDLRERVDFGLAFHADTGAIDYRAEYARHVAHDGQAGTILRAYREHLTAADDGYLKRIWPRVKKAVEYLIARDPDRDGLLDGEQYNTLDASWYGQIAWISSLYLAALRAGAAMAHEAGDDAFARICDGLAEKGMTRIVEVLFNGEYFIQRIDPKHADAINSNKGCHIDQLFGQQWAFQAGLPRVVPQKEARAALESLWKYNFTPDVGPYRKGFMAIPGGRWYAMPGEGGLLMCTWPKGGAETAPGKRESKGFAGYFNECMTGFEYQVAAHMVWEGLVEKGLAVARMIHDRYHAARRNPFNDVECSDHYARAMSSYGIFLAACGFEYHGPHGHIGFAPRLTPEEFRAPFTAAEGWGTYRQTQKDQRLTARVELKWGGLRLRSVAVELPERAKAGDVRVSAAGRDIAARSAQQRRRVVITLAEEVRLGPGEGLELTVKWG